MKKRTQIQIYAQNNLAISRYFAKNIGTTQKECAQALGLNPMTVSKHISDIRQARKEGLNQ